MVERVKEDYSPLGIFLSVCLLLLLAVQASALWVVFFEPTSQTYHDNAMFAGLTSLFAVILWVPGFILGYKILRTLDNKVVGYTTLLVSSLEFLVFLWAVAN